MRAMLGWGKVREDDPLMVLAPGRCPDSRCAAEQARWAIIPEREATLTSPKFNSYVRSAPAGRTARERAGVGQINWLVVS